MKLCWILATGCFLLGAQSTEISQDQLSSEEVFFLKRQAEFWKDRDFALIKKQIAEFFASFESSHIHNNLHAMLGDILYQEYAYADALAQYQLISDASLREKTAERRRQCLYLGGQYDEVIDDLRNQANLGAEMQFIFADSLFRKMRATSDLALALEAKPLLLDLFATSYQDKVLLPLAEIHRELKESAEAAPLYVMLAEKDSALCESFFLQAAVLQLEFDAELALSTFRHVVDLGGQKASDAAYQEMLLLFQKDRFGDLIERAPKFEALLIEERKTLLDFCLGRSYFKTDRFSESVEKLKIFIDSERENSSHKRSAFLMLIHSAKAMGDKELFNQTLSQFLPAFPKDEEAGKALLLHAQMALESGNFVQAREDLNQLLCDFPDFPDQETLLYEQASLFYKTEEWKAGRQAFITYLEQFPQTERASQIWPWIVDCAIQELKSGEGNKEELVSYLREALAFEENTSYQFLLGQLLFELQKFGEAECELEKFLQKEPHHPEAHILYALSLKETGSDAREFTIAAEKALALLGESDHLKLRLHLFNAYLSLKEYDKAAEHLYHTFIADGSVIQQENQLWLAHYYLENSNLERAELLFKKILGVGVDYRVNFDPSQTHLEAEVLEFAQILGFSERAYLLASLIDLQSTNAQFPWKKQGHALFELAKVFIELKEPKRALEKIDELLSRKEAPSIAVPALLEKSRLLLALGETDVQLILSMLKDLQIQKSLPNEPAHIEAALDYVDLRISLAAPEARAETALFFLNRIKEDFNTLDDPIAREYHENRLRFPEKDLLFQNYMQCVEAEILAWEAKEDPEKLVINREIVASLLEVLLKSEKTTNYLNHRAESILKNL